MEHPCPWVAGTEECGAAARLAELEARLAQVEVWVNPVTQTIEATDDSPHVVNLNRHRTTLAEIIKHLDWRPPRKPDDAALG